MHGGWLFDSGTAGNGLGAIKRLSNEFDVYSSAEQGSVVYSRIAGSDARTSAGPLFESCAVSLAIEGETVCGDTWAITNSDERFRFMVADGLGHGPGAAEAANKASEIFVAQDDLPPKNYLERAHATMTSTRGAAVAVGTISFNNDQLTYAGVGNISGTLLSHDKSIGLLSYNGTVGGRMRTLQNMQYVWPKEWILVMHSDGLQTRWNLQSYPGILSKHVAVIAGVLIRDFNRRRDDVTVLVVRRK